MGLSLGIALRLIPRSRGSQSPATSRTVALVGAGGKTAAMFQLALELHPSPVVTTTTHLGVWQAQAIARHVVVRTGEVLPPLQSEGVALVTGPPTADGRLAAIDQGALHSLHEQARVQGRDLLVEADGARHRPLKAPGPNEPQIPEFADVVIVVAGLGGLDQKLDDDSVHRAGIFGGLSGLQPGDRITEAAVCRVLTDLDGGLKGIPAGARKVILLNQADEPRLQARARSMAANLLASYDAVIIGSLQHQQVYAICEPRAGVVLAAGGATRFGGPKQVATWHGQPLVRIAAGNALNAGLDPVVVVTGAFSNEVASALEGLPVVMAHNPAWEQGQGSSVRCGVEALPTGASAAIFLLADQPFVGAEVIQALVETHASEGACIVAPIVDESRRANPVLFDRETFPSLLGLDGDTGGRSIMAEYPVRHLPWHDASIAYDIDTAEDLQKYREQNE